MDTWIGDLISPMLVPAALIFAFALIAFVIRRLYEFFFVPYQPPKRMRWADLSPEDRQIFEEGGYDREWFERGMEREVIDYNALLPHERERIKQDMYRGLRAWDSTLMRHSEADWIQTPMGQRVRSHVRPAQEVLEVIESLRQANTESEA